MRGNLEVNRVELSQGLLIEVMIMTWFLFTKGIKRQELKLISGRY